MQREKATVGDDVGRRERQEKEGGEAFLFTFAFFVGGTFCPHSLSSSSSLVLSEILTTISILSFFIFKKIFCSVKRTEMRFKSLMCVPYGFPPL